MPSWTKYFTTVPGQARITARLEELNRSSGQAGTSSKFSSYLPEVYAGAPNRIERYVSYDQMNLDTEINRALDTIAEFCTQNQDDDNPIPFRIIYRGDVTETEMELLKGSLQQWNSINRFNQRIFRIFRNTIMYGDQFLVRDPETFELMYVEPAKVEKIIVNEAEGKKIEQYVIRDIDFNMQSLVATNPLVHDQYSFPGGYPRSSNPASGSGNINYGQPTTPGGRTSRFFNPANSAPIDAAHVVHLSLSEGMDQYWPFGISILEAVYKVYKQKDLLEDCILIYRIVRAPERRVFYVDVGQLQGQRSMQYVERVKNEIYQRRLPNRAGGGTCLDLNTPIPLLDGRTLSLTDLISEFEQGKTNWVYSLDVDTGKIVPGLISWAGVTRTNTEVIRLTLDNGESVVCTPDHKIPVLDRGKIQARDIAVAQDSLFSFDASLGLNNGKNSNTAQFNHKVTKIECLDRPQDTGTITVDGNEIYHAHHNFALACGVFVYNSIIDSSYNPISITEDFFLATNSEQRGTKIETLGGGDNLGTIDDLNYFSNKLLRGLGIPSSYLPTGPDDGTAAYNDGKTGTAYIQEYRFNKYCMRLQSQLIPQMDMEFKLFLKNRGIEVHSSLFELAFNVPQSFSESRKMAMDTERVNLFSSIMNSDAAKYMSKRFALEKYLGWTQEDILENERMFKEENSERVRAKTGVKTLPSSGEIRLGSVGIRPQSSDGFESSFGAPPEYMPGGESAPSAPPPTGGEAPETSAPVTP